MDLRRASGRAACSRPTRFGNNLPSAVVLGTGRDRFARVVIEDPTQSGGQGPFPADSEQRLESLNGVVAAGELLSAQEPVEVSLLPSGTPGVSQGTTLGLVGVSAHALLAARAQVRDGRTLDRTSEELRLPIALVGAAAAQKLELLDAARQPTIFLGSQPFVVGGIIDDAGSEPELLLAIVVPRSAMPAILAGSESKRRWVVRTRTGAAQQVGEEVAYALRPDAREQITSLVPPSPRSLRRGVEQDTRNVFLALAALSLPVGAVGISNSALVSVMERRPEIGRLRALGASRKAIVAQFLIESGLVGLTGGIAGAALAVDAVILVAAVKDWTPVLSPVAALASPVLALIVGVIAGGYPALRAARFEPVDALRV